MATSGVYGGFTYPVNKLIEDAALEAGIAAQLLTADLLLRAMRALNLMLSSMPNLRIYTWQQRQILIPLYENVAQAIAPAGTFNLLDRQLRTPTRLSGTLVSSDGGTVAFADDNDFATIFTQPAPAGNLRLEMTTDTQLYELGILWGATADVSFVCERSDDAATWYQVDEEQTVAAVDNRWFWWSLDGAIPATYWRLRMTSGTLSAREVYFGGIPNDISIAPLNRSQYAQLPVKNQPGRPLQAWLDRQQTQTVLWLYQVPSRSFRYCHVMAFQQRMLADVTSLRETLDVPARYLDAIKAALAVRICRTFMEADKSRLKLLQEQQAETAMPAISEDRDGAPINIFPNISGYT